MDTTTLEMAGLSTTGVAIVLIVYRVLKSLKGKKFVSSCCGHKADIGFDVQNVSPVTSSSNPQKPSCKEQQIYPSQSSAGFQTASAPTLDAPQEHREPQATSSPPSAAVAV